MGRYSKKSLRKILEEAGFKVERLSYFNSILFPLILVQRLGSKLFNKKLSAHPSTPPKIINWLFREIFSQEARILKSINLPIGLSIIAVATK